MDWAQIARGQDVLYRYSGAALTGLTFQSLVGGLGANRIVETLVRTGGLSPSAARRRLLQTLQHILQCTRHPDALRPPGSWKESTSDVAAEPSIEVQENGESGEGFVATVRVRLLHASVRRRILRLEREKPGYFDVDGWGIPVCDLDSAATIASFSASVIWLSLPRQGIWPKEQEVLDYIALWRYIGYLLGYPSKTAVERYASSTKQEEEKNSEGMALPYRDMFSAAEVASATGKSIIDPDFFVSPKRAKALFESLLIYEVEPSATSRLLARNILVSLANQPPVHVSVSMLAATTRWLIGRQLADALDVPTPSPYLYYSALAMGQCCFFAGMALLDRTYMTLSRYRLRLAGVWRGRLGRFNKKAYGIEESKDGGSKSTSGTNAEVLASADTAEIEAAIQSGQTGYWFGQTKIKRLKVFLWTFVVQSKAGLAGKPTKFDFEFVPKVTMVAPAVPEHPSYNICVNENAKMDAVIEGPDEGQAHLLENGDDDGDDDDDDQKKVGKGFRYNGFGRWLYRPSKSQNRSFSPKPENPGQYYEKGLQSNNIEVNAVDHARRIEYRNLRALLIVLILIMPPASVLAWYLGRWAWGVVLLTVRRASVSGNASAAAAANGAARLAADAADVANTAVDVLGESTSRLMTVTLSTIESLVLEMLEIFGRAVAFVDSIAAAIAAGFLGLSEPGFMLDNVKMKMKMNVNSNMNMNMNMTGPVLVHVREIVVQPMLAMWDHGVGNVAARRFGF